MRGTAGITRTCCVAFLASVLVQCALRPEPAVRDAVFSEPQTAGLLRTVHDSEELTARMLSDRSSDDRLRSFAQAIEEGHSAAASRESRLFARHGIEPEPSATSSRWAIEASYELSALREQRSPSIDRTYVDQKCFAWLRLLNLIDNAMVPSARSEWLADELRQVRGTVAAHLDEARALQKWLDRQDEARLGEGRGEAGTWTADEGR